MIAPSQFSMPSPTLGLTVRARLISLALLLAAVWGLSLAVTTAGFLSTKASAHRATRSFDAFKAERDAYEGWLTQDDQSNMASALAVVLNASNRSLYTTTWGQVWAGHAQAVASLARTAQLAPSAAVRAAVARTERDLAAYTVFTHEVQAAANAGQARRAVELMSVINAPVSNQTQADFDHVSSLLATQVGQVRTEVSSTVSSSLRWLALIALISIPLAAIAIALIIRSITRPLDAVTKSAERIARGDLAVDVKVSQSRDELARMSRAFRASVEHLQEMAQAASEIASGNLTVEVSPKSDADTLGKAFVEMRERLSTMLTAISGSAVTVAGAAAEMAASSEESVRSLGDIVRSVTTVLQGAEDQVKSVELAKQVTDDLASASQTSVEAATETSSAAARARQIAHDGLEAAGRASTAMQDVRATTGQVTAAIRSLGEKSTQIGDFVDTITGIAAQTNLLALNAAIEAARAGDQGRGFAVVADEVRQLAEESQNAAATIADVIQSIQREMDRAVEVVEVGARQTDDGVATVEEARVAFERLGESVEEMNQLITGIVDSIRAMAANGSEMQRTMGAVATVAEQSTASTEEVSAITEHTTRGAEQISASAQELSATADELEELVSRFTLR
jgi:methyl-accepting chemotaxis protein